ncbi:TPA: restriction endonuclease subunit S [Escherichia coli]|nr:restriction endonuclease subunit S [Escherichia coli]HAM5641176.1 restriction endonuclease subunit S [Escherichia coli]HBQ4174829.1 restriction endonuclease subunit S [Escherichia coli]
MGSKWVHAKLGDYIDSNLGKMLDQNKNKGDFHPYLGNSNVRWGYFDLENLSLMKFEEHESDRYGIRKGDLIICEGGEPGRCAIWEDDVPNMKIQKALHRVRPLPGLTSEYLYYWFLYFGRTGQLDAYFTGTTIKHLTGKALSELPIEIPPIDEQKHISMVLGSLDTKIKANRKINKTLEQMSQTLFKSWFVDFDPVIDNALDAANPIPEALQSRAELRQKVRNSTDFKPLPAEIRSLFPSEFEETELGWVPKGWESETFDSFCDLIQSGGTPSRKETSFWDGGTIKWLSSGEVKGKIVLDTKEKITDIGLLNSSSKLWEKYTTVVAMYGATAGEVCIIGDKMAANQACCGLYSKTFPFFVYNFVCNKANELASKATGSAQQNLNKLIISTTKFICPSNDIITIFEDNVTPLFMKWFSNSSENNTLTALRDTLLPKLISGELSVEDLPDHIKQTEAA